MAPVLVLYATREGQTRRIAEHLVRRLGELGLDAELHDVSVGVEMALEGYAGAILAASVHMGRHDPTMVGFAARHRAALERLPTAFLSVSLTEAQVEDSSAPGEAREAARAEVERLLEGFFTESGWHPEMVQPVAGALLYRQYNFFLRLFIKQIAKSRGMPSDTSRDHVFTDWEGLDRFAEAFASRLVAPDRPRPSPGARG